MIRTLLSLFSLLFVACGTNSSNKAPIAQMVVSSTVMEVSETLYLDGNRSSDDSGKVSFAWFDPTGASLGTESKTTWKAPAIVGDYILKLVVTDDDGAKDSLSVTVTVNASFDEPPSASVSVAKVNVSVGEDVHLDGQGSFDSDGYIQSYVWHDSDGNVIAENNTSTVWKPSKEGKQRITLTVKDEYGVADVAFAIINVSAFAPIQNLIATRKGVQYICVGDSTRDGVDSLFYDGSHYDGGHIFDRLEAKLSDYNVTSYLIARSGQRARDFNLESVSPTWVDVEDIIKDDGARCIVDISLGINDYSRGSVAIKQDIVEAIEKIKLTKPKTHFFLTMPNPKDPGDRSVVGHGKRLKAVYEELAREQHYPLVNLIDELDFVHTMFRDDKIHFHLTPDAQRRVSEVILGKILP